MSVVVCALALVGLAHASHAAPAPSPTMLVVLGDSLSDTGNLAALTRGLIPPSPPYAPGRVSNGPVWVDYAAERLGLPVDNLAVAGARTGHGNQFDGLLGRDFPGLLDELQRFIARNRAGGDPDAVYVVWAGSNDFLSAPAPATIGTAVSNIAATVFVLQAFGARRVLVVNVPDLGSTPEGLASGQSAELTALAAGFNTVLARTLAASGLGVAMFDVFGLMRRVVADPGAFGLSDVSTPCLDPATFAVCEDPDAHLFWDTVHPTTRGHEILAGKLKKAIKQLAREPINPERRNR